MLYHDHYENSSSNEIALVKKELAFKLVVSQSSHNSPRCVLSALKKFNAIILDFLKERISVSGREESSEDGVSFQQKECESSQNSLETSRCLVE